MPRRRRRRGTSAYGGLTISGPTTANEKFDDDDYPAYTMGRAAEMLGTTQAFLRSLDEAKLITPQRSVGGHRRYSRYQLRIAARARELIDNGTPWKQRVASSSSKTNSAKRSNSTPNSPSGTDQVLATFGRRERPPSASP